MEKNNFHYGQILLDMQYGIELDDEEYEELALLAWDKIGNKNVRLYEYTTCINGADNSIKLPCNLSSIEAVTGIGEDWKRVTNYSLNGDLYTSFIENRIETQKYYKSPYYTSGKLLSYEQVGDTLYFKLNYGTVKILYKGILADDEGLPEITDKEADAIATYVAFVIKYKEGLLTNNTVIINLASNLEDKWRKKCDQARIKNLSQNDMNEILNVKDSWNRHIYGTTYKPIHK